MIPELVLWVTARADRGARRLGLVGGAVALWSRATRRRRDWAAHEAACHAVIRDAVDALPARRTVLVLGSGLLRDVPVDDLARRFARVILVDAVHLWPARRIARRHGCELVLADLSGVASWLSGVAAGRDDPLAAFRHDPDLDLVISANLLSQLPFAPLRAAERRAPPGLPNDLAAAIVGWHLADLAAFRCPVCLLTDVGYRDVGPGGIAEDEADLLHGHALPSPDATWDWTVAPPGEIGRGISRVHRVHAFRDLGGASWGDTGAARE